MIDEQIKVAQRMNPMVMETPPEEDDKTHHSTGDGTTSSDGDAVDGGGDAQNSAVPESSSTVLGDGAPITEGSDSLKESEDDHGTLQPLPQGLVDGLMHGDDDVLHNFVVEPGSDDSTPKDDVVDGERGVGGVVNELPSTTKRSDPRDEL